MCLVNVPGYFYAVWKVISPWLDGKIQGKTCFASKEVDDYYKQSTILDMVMAILTPHSSI